MLIREAKISDVKKIKELDTIWYNEGITPYMSKTSLAELKKHVRQGGLFVAEDKGLIVGFALAKACKINQDMKLYGLKKNQKYLDFDSLYIIKGYRNKGVGGMLVKKVEEYAKSEKVKSILISADNIKPELLISFYSRYEYKTHYVKMFKKL